MRLAGDFAPWLYFVLPHPPGRVLHQLGLLHQPARARRAGRRRNGQRHRRHDRAPPPRLDGRRAHRCPRWHLSFGIRRRTHERLDPVLGRRPQRHSLHRLGHRGLRPHRAAETAGLFGLRRRPGPRLHDDSARSAHDRGGAGARPAQLSRGRARARASAVEGYHPHRPAHRAERHHHRRPARHGARGRRDRSTALYRVWQQLLEPKPFPAGRRAAAADFQLRHLPLRRLAPAGLGRRPRVGRAHFLSEPQRSFSLPGKTLKGLMHHPMTPRMNEEIKPTRLNPPARAAQPSAASPSAPAVPAGPPAFDVKNLCVWYGAQQTLHDVTLQVPTRSVTSIIGPSGCGKSTFLRTLNRMHELVPGARHSGEILMLGQNLYSPEVDATVVRRRVGMVFQKSNPFPTMSIAENVLVGLRLNGLNDKALLRQRLEESLRMAALWDEVKDHLGRPGTSLSGGQQQRLCIARALAVKPEIILMDEPCSALDPIATSKVEELIHEIKKDYTVVIVTHNMQQAARCSDRTAFFYMGKLIEFDETRTIFMNPANPQTEAYVSGRFG